MDIRRKPQSSGKRKRGIDAVKHSMADFPKEKVKQTLWVYEDNEKMVHKSIAFVPYLYNIFNELLIRAAQNARRLPGMDSMIKVEIDRNNNCIEICNIGYGKTGWRKWLKRRGPFEGVHASYISTHDWVENPDGIRSYKTVIKVTYQPDLSSFNMTHLEDDMVHLMRKRVVDIAGCLSQTLKVELDGKLIDLNSFTHYCKLYLSSAKEENLPISSATVDNGWEVCCSVTKATFQQVSFVNLFATTKGGTHVQHVTNQIEDHLATYCTIPRTDVHIWVFVNAFIDQPAFDSHFTEALITPQECFAPLSMLSPSFLSNVSQTVITATSKKIDEPRRISPTVQSNIYEAYEAGRGRRHECSLILTQGDGALSLALAGISVVGPATYGVYAISGSLPNVREASLEKIMGNAEIQTIKRLLGLCEGEVYDNVSSLRYDHLMIMTNQDLEGSHIKGLLINFFHFSFPQLLKIESFLVDLVTPLLSATPLSGDKKLFYSMPEYHSWREGLGENVRDWEISSYIKGLHSILPHEIMECFKSLNNHKRTFCWKDDKDGEAIEMAFSYQARKKWLQNFKVGTDVHLQLQANTFFGQKAKIITYSDFVNKELILFFLANLQKSIPSMVDGLNSDQRKILFWCLTQNFIGVEIFSEFYWFILEHSALCNGVPSLATTTVGMMQRSEESNNINLLEQEFQTGSWLMAWKVAGSARDLSPKLCPITRAIFHKDDDFLLYSKEYGQPFEPSWYIPVVPMVLVNGSDGNEMGWSSSVPKYNLIDIIQNIGRLLKGEAVVPMNPWYRGFEGTIEKTSTKDGDIYIVSGIIKQVNETTLEVLELPVGICVKDYVVFLSSLMSGKEIEEYRYLSYGATPYFEVIMTAEKLKLAKEKDLLKIFKLTTSISTNNMHLFDLDGRIKKYESAEHILKEFFDYRLGLYEKRKEEMLKSLKLKHQQALNRARLYKEVCDRKIDIFHKGQKDLDLLFRANEYLEGPDGGYGYLLSFSDDGYDIKEKDKVEEEIKALEGMSAGSLWEEDLTSLREEYTKQLAREDERDPAACVKWEKDLTDLKEICRHLELAWRGRETTSMAD